MEISTTEAYTDLYPTNV